MDTNRIVSSLCYFSLFFAPFLFPIIVYFIVDHSEVKNHAKKSFLSHLIPIITVPIVAVPVLLSSGEPTMLAVGGIFAFLLIGAINIGVLIWNVVKGVKILID
ncbi:DUF4870 domain-containing protein [Calidifontibacillus oryziterrae]|uniref:DUF4870 domain-containing protein n=1 Tax=Calidifontibacillus oryziterrae TaxID=1191699 RepID=UPI00031B3002|nr:DUF4870 domain-containing protein [Calidifontibacillus oryziterrae]